MQKVKTKNGGVTFHYIGDLQKELDKARAELERKQGSKKQEFLTWQYQKAKKELETFNQRITDLTDFIRLAEEKLKEQNTESGA